MEEKTTVCVCWKKKRRVGVVAGRVEMKVSQTDSQEWSEANSLLQLFYGGSEIAKQCDLLCRQVLAFEASRGSSLALESLKARVRSIPAQFEALELARSRMMAEKRKLEEGSARLLADFEAIQMEICTALGLERLDPAPAFPNPEGGHHGAN